MSIVHRSWIGLAALLGSVVLISVPRVAATETARQPGQRQPVSPAVQMSVSAQDYNVTAGVPIQMSLAVPPTVDLRQLSPRASVRVSIGAPATSRDQLVDASSGLISVIVDTVTLPIDQVPRTATNLFIAVPTETTTRLQNALRLPLSGTAPLRIEVLDDGAVVAQLITFVHRTDVTGGPLRLGLAIGTNARVTIDDQGAPRLDESAIAQIERLITALPDTAGDGLPIFLNIAPSAAEALAGQRPDLFAELKKRANGLSIGSQPALPLDPSDAASGGAATVYGNWLTSGDQLSRRLLAVAPTRAAYVVDRPLSPDGADLVLANGATLLLTTSAQFDRLRGSPGAFFDPSKVVRAATSGDTRLNIKVPDRRISTILGQPSSDPKLSAIRAVSDLLIVRQQASAERDLGNRAVIVATDTIGVPDRDVLHATIDLIRQVPELSWAPIDDIATTSTPMRGVLVSLPAAGVSNVGERIEQQVAYRAKSADVASMLPITDPRRELWNQRVEALPTSALSDARVAAILDTIDEEQQQVFNAVVPPAPFSVTLGGNEATLHLRLRNTSDLPLKVRIRMSSGAAKLTFPQNDQIAELAPEAVTELEIPVVARSQGKFPIFVQVLTPAASTLLVPPIPGTARVSALSGLGNLATVGFALLVLIWWSRNWRKARRVRATTVAANDN